MNYRSPGYEPGGISWLSHPAIVSKPVATVKGSDPVARVRFDHVQFIYRHGRYPPDDAALDAPADPPVAASGSLARSVATLQPQREDCTEAERDREDGVRGVAGQRAARGQPRHECENQRQQPQDGNHVPLGETHPPGSVAHGRPYGAHPGNSRGGDTGPTVPPCAGRKRFYQ